MQKVNTDIDAAVSRIIGDLETKNQARDRALVESRQAVRHAATGIRALHRGEHERAHESLSAGLSMVQATKRDLERYPDLYWTGYVQDAQKEIAEACIVAAILQSRELPAPAELGVEPAPYLNGMAEAASEMRRYVLDIIRRGGEAEMQEAERVLQIMDDVYTNLITVDFPDAITGGLRRTTDSLRGVLERTRGDLTISIRQADLARALQRGV
ncbi:MAG TPA: haloacid dehalogenase [Chloroflexota bacterium]|jgi:translin